jgi:hypothetical protein
VPVLFEPLSQPRREGRERNRDRRTRAALYGFHLLQEHQSVLDGFFHRSVRMTGEKASHSIGVEPVHALPFLFSRRARGLAGRRASKDFVLSESWYAGE